MERLSRVAVLLLLLFFWVWLLLLAGSPLDPCPAEAGVSGQVSTAAPVEATGQAERTLCEKIEAVWQSISGLPYVWGGQTPEDGGYDCSGAIYHVSRRIGRPVPRTTSARYYLLVSGPDKHWSDATCGDWIWWTLTPARPFGHIGMHHLPPGFFHSGSSTGPTRATLIPSGFWDRHFKASKTPADG